MVNLVMTFQDFGERYRVGPTNPTTNNDGGDLVHNTGSNKMLVYNATNTAWEEVQSIGQFFEIPSSELADFAAGTAATEVITQCTRYCSTDHSVDQWCNSEAKLWHWYSY